MPTPTPTVDRSRSPVPIPAVVSDCPTIPAASQSTTSTPIPIPISSIDSTDLNSKRTAVAAQDGCIHDALLRATAPYGDEDKGEPTATSMSTSNRSATATPLSSTSPEQASNILATSPPTRSSATDYQQHNRRPQDERTSAVAPSLESRPWEVATSRIRPTITSSFLRPYSRFVGTQKSDKATYNVQVELKYVDMARSQLGGFLTIEGLTPNLPTITTYFEGEILGTKHTFLTTHPTWGATAKTDTSHWSRFPQWHPQTDITEKLPGSVHEPTMAQNRYIYMRWKELFLVADHRRTDLPGASFEGFYYICFDQRRGSVEGIYFHAKTEKYQRLELGLAEQVGCMKGFATGMVGREKGKRREEKGLGLRMFAPPAIEFR